MAPCSVNDRRRDDYANALADLSVRMLTVKKFYLSPKFASYARFARQATTLGQMRGLCKRVRLSYGHTIGGLEEAHVVRAGGTIDMETTWVYQASLTKVWKMSQTIRWLI